MSALEVSKGPGGKAPRKNSLVVGAPGHASPGSRGSPKLSSRRVSVSSKVSHSSAMSPTSISRKHSTSSEHEKAGGGRRGRKGSVDRHGHPAGSHAAAGGGRRKSVSAESQEPEVSY